MAIRTSVEIKPVDIRKIRQALGFSQKRMGECLTNYIQDPERGLIPGTRINEWERGDRATPDQVFIAYAGVLVDRWAEVRGRKSEHEVTNLDPKFAKLLSPALASAIAFETEFRSRRDKEGMKVYAKAQKLRQDVQNYLESLLLISMAKIKFPG